MGILLTGEIGVGKTSICNKVVDELKSRGYNVFGILTFPIISSGRRTGFYMIDIKTGETAILAEEHGYNGPILGRFVFSQEGIEFGLRALSREGNIAVVDEIGRLEIEGKGFRDAIPKIESCEGLIVTARSKFAEEVMGLFDSKMDLDIYEVTLENRDSLPSIIFETESRSMK